MRIYKVKLKKSAIKELSKLSKPTATKIAKKLLLLEEEPRPTGCKKLKGYTNMWRIREGDYRIIYSIEDRILVVEVLEIGHRKDIY